MLNLARNFSLITKIYRPYVNFLAATIFNPRLPEPFYVTRFPKGVVTTPP